jgi:hypothetical protein
MFRHERPQRGRYRQFFQFGAEAIGFTGPDIDAELIMLCRRLWDDLGLENIRLELNSIGDAAERAAPPRRPDRLLRSAHRPARRRSEAPPAHQSAAHPRHQEPCMQDLVNGAPKLLDYLEGESLAHFEGVKRILDHNNVQYTVNPRLVRGLDYYNRTVFEWVTDELGAQGTVCAGGRYDPLIESVRRQADAGGRLRDGHRAPDRADEAAGEPAEPPPATSTWCTRASGAACRPSCWPSEFAMPASMLCYIARRGGRGQLQEPDEKGRRQRRRLRRDPRRRRDRQRSRRSRPCAQRRRAAAGQRAVRQAWSTPGRPDRRPRPRPRPRALPPLINPLPFTRRHHGIRSRRTRTDGYLKAFWKQYGNLITWVLIIVPGRLRRLQLLEPLPAQPVGRGLGPVRRAANALTAKDNAKASASPRTSSRSSSSTAYAQMARWRPPRARSTRTT